MNLGAVVCTLECKNTLKASGGRSCLKLRSREQKPVTTTLPPKVPVYSSAGILCSKGRNLASFVLDLFADA